MKPKEVLGAFGDKKVVYHSITIPEGFRLNEIAELMAGTGLCTKEEALASLNDNSLIAKFEIPADTMEGYVFPETYKFTRPDGAKEMAERMLIEGTKHKTADFLNRSTELGFSFHNILTLASVIEKETGAAEERASISSVFHNRLRIGMPLQSDPTVIYGIPNFDGNLTRQHLKTPTRYNTYINDGLPPNPIASPGLESIKAALYPSDTDFLYFVSKGNGSHIFSKSYKEHRRNVNKYQKGIRPKKEAAKKPAPVKTKPAPVKPKIDPEKKKKAEIEAFKKRLQAEKKKSPPKPKPAKRKKKQPVSQLDFD